MSRESVYSAQLRDKFAREALADLPKDAPAEQRRDMERRASEARAIHAQAAHDAHAANKRWGIV